MTTINVITQTQRIIVDPASSSIRIANVGPRGPAGPAGPSSPIDGGSPSSTFGDEEILDGGAP